MKPTSTETPFLHQYLILSAIQFPVWMFGGMFWTGMMTVVFGHHPVGAFIGGLAWGFLMWLTCGNLFAASFAWRRVAEFPAPDRAEFLVALRKAADKSRHLILAESADEVVLGPKRALVRFRSQESRVTFTDGKAVVIGPALTMGVLRKQLTRALAQATGEKPRRRGEV